MFDDGRVVVTGGAGFIGSALIWELNRRGVDRILVADHPQAPNQWKNLLGLRFEDYIDAGELAERTDANPAALGTVSAVFHLGACSSTTERDLCFLLRNNYEYSKRIARWATSVGARFIYASSAATYGSLEESVTETKAIDTLRPLNAYGFSKQLFDLWATRNGLGERAVGLKYFNIFGPNEEHKGDMRSMVSRAYEQIRATGAVKLFRSYRPEFADGEQRRDFLYVKDAVAMTVHLAATPAAHGLFNIGSGRAQTWLDLVRPIFPACHQTERIEFIEMPEALRNQYQYHTRACIDKLRAAGYSQPATALDVAVTEYVRDYLIPGRSLGDGEFEHDHDGKQNR